MLQFKSPVEKIIQVPNTCNQAENIHQLKITKNLPMESITHPSMSNQGESTRNNCIQQIKNASKITLVHLKKLSKIPNRTFPARSPASFSIISDHQIQEPVHSLYESPSSHSSSHHELTDKKSIYAYRLDVTDEQKSLSERYIMIPDKYVKDF